MWEYWKYVIEEKFLIESDRRVIENVQLDDRKNYHVKHLGAILSQPSDTCRA